MEEAHEFMAKTLAQRLRLIAATVETEKTAACAVTLFGIPLHELLDHLANEADRS